MLNKEIKKIDFKFFTEEPSGQIRIITPGKEEKQNDTTNSDGLSEFIYRSDTGIYGNMDL